MRSVCARHFGFGHDHGQLQLNEPDDDTLGRFVEATKSAHVPLLGKMSGAPSAPNAGPSKADFRLDSKRAYFRLSGRARARLDGRQTGVGSAWTREGFHREPRQLHGSRENCVTSTVEVRSKEKKEANESANLSTSSGAELRVAIAGRADRQEGCRSAGPGHSRLVLTRFRRSTPKSTATGSAR